MHRPATSDHARRPNRSPPHDPLRETQGNRVNFSEVFIKRPIATSLLMAGIALFGVIAYRSLPVSDLPNVEYPDPAVSSASLPGANPDHHGLRRRHPAGTAVHHHRGPRLHDSRQSSTGQHRSRCSSISSRDIDGAPWTCRRPLPKPCRCCRPACRAAFVPKSNPGRSAHLLSSRSPRDAFRSVASRRLCRADDRAAHLDGQRRSAGAGLGLARSMPFACKWIPISWRARQIGINEVEQRHLRTGTSILPPARLYGPPQAFNVQANGAAHDAAGSAP